MKVYLYAEPCLMAGRRVSLEAHSEAPDAADFICYEGTSREILEHAEALERAAERLGGGTGSYMRRSARSLREACDES